MNKEEKVNKGITGGDFDFPRGTERIDILKHLESFAKAMPKAESAEMILIGQLEQKDAFRVRIKIVTKEGVG